MLETSFPGKQLFLTFSGLEKIPSWRKTKHLIGTEVWPHPSQGKNLAQTAVPRWDKEPSSGEEQQSRASICNSSMGCS